MEVSVENMNYKNEMKLRRVHNIVLDLWQLQHAVKLVCSPLGGNAGRVMYHPALTLQQLNKLYWLEKSS